MKNISEIEDGLKGSMVETEEKRLRVNQRLDEIWDQYDTDGDGVLNFEEGKLFLIATIKALTGSEPTEEEIKKKFNEIDEDGNKTLDRDEVADYLISENLC